MYNVHAMPHVQCTSYALCTMYILWPMYNIHHMPYVQCTSYALCTMYILWPMYNVHSMPYVQCTLYALCPMYNLYDICIVPYMVGHLPHNKIQHVLQYTTYVMQCLHNVLYALYYAY